MADQHSANQAVTQDDPWTVRRVLQWTIDYLKQHGSENPRLDAEILLAHSRKCQRILLYTQFDEPLSESERAQMRSLVKRRSNAEPVAYLVGHREFFSLKFDIEPGVFIPRPDTETLVAAALDALKLTANPDVLELCTGSGCIAIAIAKNCPKASVKTVELNPIPLRVAERNIAKHQVGDRVTLVHGDLFHALSGEERFDLIVSNPPYVPDQEIETLDADVREHEPREALAGGADGLDVIRKIIQQSPDFLKSDGWLMFELSPEQAATACNLMSERGFDNVTAKDDLSGNPRIVIGCWRRESH